MAYQLKVIEELSEKLLAFGFRVFLSESKTYGFYTNEKGCPLISFQVNYLTPVFSGNYSPATKRHGTGWRIKTNPDTKEDFERLLYSFPSYPLTTDDNQVIKWTCLEEYLCTYKHSKFTELKMESNQDTTIVPSVEKELKELENLLQRHIKEKEDLIRSFKNRGWEERSHKSYPTRLLLSPYLVESEKEGKVDVFHWGYVTSPEWQSHCIEL